MKKINFLAMIVVLVAGTAYAGGGRPGNTPLQVSVGVPVVQLVDGRVASAEETAAKYGVTVQYAPSTTTNRPQTNAPQGGTFYGATGHVYGQGNVSSVPGSPYDVPGGSGQLSTSQGQTLNVYTAGNREYIDPEHHNAALDIHDATLLERESVTSSTIALSREETSRANGENARKRGWFHDSITAVSVIGGLVNQREAIKEGYGSSNSRSRSYSYGSSSSSSYNERRNEVYLNREKLRNLETLQRLNQRRVTFWNSQKEK